MANQEKNTSTLGAFSNQMADAVEQAAASLVVVHGRRRMGASGVVFADDLVLTADHVLEREEELSVETGDGRKLAAQFAGRDPATDLAVLKVTELRLKPATKAGEKARVGQFVMAVGRPSSSGPMASLGIVSAVGGPLRSRRGAMLEEFIQTDATPYPGFSGGPLIDTQGAVLGITTTGLLNGVALAVPAEIAWRVAETLFKQGRIKRGFLGISSQPVELPANQRAGRAQDSGLLIVRVEEGSPAEQGGLLLGDILVSLAGTTVTDTDILQGLLAGDYVGKPVKVEVVRGGTLHTLEVSIGQRS